MKVLSINEIKNIIGSEKGLCFCYGYNSLLKDPFLQESTLRCRNSCCFVGYGYNGIWWLFLNNPSQDNMLAAGMKRSCDGIKNSAFGLGITDLCSNC